MAIWSVWRPFPDPQGRGILTAPFGAGCYELRRSDTRGKVLFGSSGHVAHRMTSLLPAPLGSGTRHNSKKREYILHHVHSIEYRTTACITRAEALNLERALKVNRSAYLFKT
jgi:hypothetical protein